MIERIDSSYYLTCDICGEEHSVEFDCWDDAVEAKKEDGWKSKRINGEWNDVCPDCQKQK